MAPATVKLEHPYRKPLLAIKVSRIEEILAAESSLVRRLQIAEDIAT
jgi:hypothetical protein